MSDSTLPALPTPRFPQHVYDGTLIDHLVRLAETAVASAALGRCEFTDEYCNCREQATVHHLGTEQELCARHFLAVSRG